MAAETWTEIWAICQRANANVYNTSRFSALDLLKLCLLFYLLVNKSCRKVLRKWASVFPRWYKCFIKLIPALLCKLYQVPFVLNREINRSNMLQGVMLYAWTAFYFYIKDFPDTTLCNEGKLQYNVLTTTTAAPASSKYWDWYSLIR